MTKNLITHANAPPVNTLFRRHSGSTHVYFYNPCTSGPATLYKSFLASKTSLRLNPEFLSWGPNFLLLHHYHVTGFRNQEI